MCAKGLLVLAALCGYTATHLDLDIPAVDDLYDAHNIIKHQAHFLTVV